MKTIIKAGLILLFVAIAGGVTAQSYQDAAAQAVQPDVSTILSDTAKPTADIASVADAQIAYWTAVKKAQATMATSTLAIFRTESL